jgi:hypothetical protein
MFEQGIINLTNWLGNVILPTLAGLCFAAAIYQFSKGKPTQNLTQGGIACLMCSGFVHLLEAFSQQSGVNDPDRYWMAILTLVNWVGNVVLPLYGVFQIVAMVLHFAGLLERLTIGEAWVRNLVSAILAFSLSGVLRLTEALVNKGAAGVR